MVAFADARLNGAEILVVAEDGTQREYVIRYNIVKTNITQLADLQIYDSENNEFVTINGFNVNKFEYNVELPWRTSSEPVLNPIAMLPNQIIEIVYGGVNGTTTITVTAEDGTTKRYTIIVTRKAEEKTEEKPAEVVEQTKSNNSLLQELCVAQVINPFSFINFVIDIPVKACILLP